MDKQELKTYLCQLVLVDESSIDDDQALFSMGILDSLNLLEVVRFVEEKNNIQVSPKDMTLENWDSLNRIQEFIKRKRGLQNATESSDQ